MRVLVLLGFAVATLPQYGNAADPPPAPPAQPKAAATPTATTAAVRTPDNIRTITIDPNAPRPVCKRIVPTGSRIAERRCEAPQTTAQAEANRATLRRDFESMREQQMLRDQARQAAMGEALRRRAAQ